MQDKIKRYVYKNNYNKLPNIFYSSNITAFIINNNLNCYEGLEHISLWLTYSYNTETTNFIAI